MRKGSHFLESFGVFFVSAYSEADRKLAPDCPGADAFLLSALYLECFLSDSSEEEFQFVKDQSDAEKIAANFGKKPEFIRELALLLDKEHSLFRKQLLDIMQSGIEEYASEFFRKSVERGLASDKITSINAFLEDIMYTVGMRAKVSANFLIYTKRPVPSEEDRSQIAMDDLLQWKSVYLCWESSRVPASGSEKLGCMLSMMDNGLMAMNFESSRKRDGEAIMTGMTSCIAL